MSSLLCLKMTGISFKNKKWKKIKPIIKTWFDQSIEQNVMGNKPKIITDKLNNKIIADILKLFERKEETNIE